MTGTLLNHAMAVARREGVETPVLAIAKLANCSTSTASAARQAVELEQGARQPWAAPPEGRPGSKRARIMALLDARGGGADVIDVAEVERIARETETHKSYVFNVRHAWRGLRGLATWEGRRAETVKPENEQPVERVARRCLGCGDSFNAKGRLNRLCRPCDRDIASLQGFMGAR